MNDKKLRQLFDFQKFEKDETLEYAILSAHAYAARQSSDNVVRLSDNDMEMLSAAGVQHPVKPVKPVKK